MFLVINWIEAINHSGMGDSISVMFNVMWEDQNTVLWTNDAFLVSM
jgi:hypothetical protein